MELDDHQERVGKLMMKKGVAYWDSEETDLTKRYKMVRVRLSDGSVVVGRIAGMGHDVGLQVRVITNIPFFSIVDIEAV